MRSSDVVSLYNTVGLGAKVEIVNEPLSIASPEAEPEASGQHFAQVGMTQRIPR